MWQDHDWCDRAAVVLDPYAAQSEVPRDILSGRVPGAVALVCQESQRRQPTRRGNPETRLFRVRLRAHARAAATVGLRDRALAKRAEPGERRQGSRFVSARAGL